MFSVEIKVNGRLVGHLYGHNEGALPQTEDDCLYSYEYYEVGRGVLKNGHVTHTRGDGIEKLVGLILIEMESGNETSYT